MKKFEILLYRLADYSGYTEALEDGAVYGNGLYITEEQLKDTEYVCMLLRLMSATEDCINGGMTEVWPVLVDPEKPDYVYDHLIHYSK